MALGLGAGSRTRRQVPQPLLRAIWPPAVWSATQSWAQCVAGGISGPRAGMGLMGAWPLPVCLQDSVLAFWSHGMQGRSLDTNEVRGTREPRLSHLLGEDALGWLQRPISSQVTQEITDETRIFRVLGAHR